MNFPYESIPDGTVWVFHHYTYPLVFAYIFTDWLSDNIPEKEPKYVDVGIGIGLISFLLAWTHYPVFGSVGSLIGLLVITYGLAFNDVWDEYGRRWRLLIAFLTLMAYDDWVSHALGWWTPADAAFKYAFELGLIL